MIEKDFIPYEIALELKQLGFDEPCFGYHYTLNGKDWKFADNHKYHEIDDQLVIGSKFTLLAPTYSQAFRWFRDKYGLYINLIYDWNDEIYRVTIMVQNEDKSCKVIYLKEGDYIKEYKTLEEAELACLKKLIELVKESNKSQEK
jgi:hypothetical protein